MRRGSNLACVLRDREYGTGYRTGGHQLRTEGDYLEDHGAKPVINQSCELSGKCRATFLTAFSSDGTKVASTHGDHTVRVTEISTGKCTHVLKGHPRTPWCVAFHPSYNQILASGCLGGEVRIWDLHGFGSEVWRCKENYVISSLAFHPTDHVLVFAVWNEIHFWDWSQPEPFTHRKTANSYERVRWLKFDPLGHFLYTGIANDTTVRPASSSRVSFINGRPADGQRVQQLSHVYDELVECFQASRRSRILQQANSQTTVQRPHEANNGMLENALRTRPFIRPSDISHTESSNDEPATSWHSLERHHLHPHYSVSILDNTINRPNDPIQMAINRAIAAKVNVIVQHCKLHNEASCDISQDGTMLTTFVPSHRGFPDDNILAVYSLLPKTRGQCLFTKSFGSPNAISVSLSPMNNYVMVGLAAKRLSWVFTPNQLVARILKLENKEAGENSMQDNLFSIDRLFTLQVVTDVMHPCDTDIRTHVSVNAARWLPSPGEGIVYGTNRGDLHICRPGAKITTKGDWSAELAHAESIRRHLFSMMRSNAPGGPGIPPLANTATQTLRVRRSAGTQTDTDSPEYEYRSSIV
ncbi:hypothetical protein FSP39_016323 [Pinctada imbricata]|uniref:Activating molecule in BECN1-regulated autophagy protein 1 n=1 Tax=Pinctada imbricata TaxID=66713 RepID=A0AA88XUZ8_PINIB|nr:hypothetical protein FSP39_016323 [Pinctada imbricata]